jgi:hypothetical protein
MRVINTAFTLLFVPSQKTYYLYADVDTWYTASDIKGKWALTNKVPSQVAARAPQQETQEADEADPEDGGKPGPPPAVVVETEPAELISSKGEPEYTPISGTDLLYMSNTDSDVLLDITSQRHFVLLAGRWFASSSLQGRKAKWAPYCMQCPGRT